MFKFLKRAFVNNDKKKDEIVLSDIYQQSSINFLPNITGRKRKIIINILGVFVISTIFFLNMFYVFDKTNNPAVLAVGNFTEVVYKCFPMDMKAVYQRSNLMLLKRKIYHYKICDLIMIKTIRFYHHLLIKTH